MKPVTIVGGTAIAKGVYRMKNENIVKDLELSAITVILEAFRPLNKQAIDRTIRYLAARFRVFPIDPPIGDSNIEPL